MRQSKNRENGLRALSRILPPLGMRIIKTSVAVLLVLLFYWLRGYRGQAMPTEAAITAIICMQPYVRDSRDYAVSRFTGTLIGAAWGLMFLLPFLALPGLGNRLFAVYLLMALGVLASLYTAVLLRRPDSSALPPSYSCASSSPSRISRSPCAPPGTGSSACCWGRASPSG